MRQLLVLFLLLVCNNLSFAQNESADKQAIRDLMKKQEQAWSNHDLEGFMAGYWKSDSLRFFGANGLTYGWQKTLDNYTKGYPTKDHTGILKFAIESLTKINDGAYFVMGRYHLDRKAGEAKGVFMIIFKKIQGKWKIIADTSC
ncbi:MAG: nuclear transport factor 2 family protein [Flavobacteriaceae bacterium]|nr:nuclear transport factor 2 family protein [Flavobacteriaceae bacterium]